jgi:hypothetical protein
MVDATPSAIEPDAHVAAAMQMGFLRRPERAVAPGSSGSLGALLAAEVALVESAGALGVEVFCPTTSPDPAATDSSTPDPNGEWAMMPDGIPGATVQPDVI